MGTPLFLGFDMVPRLSSSKKVQARWSLFLEEIKTIYKDDPLFTLNENESFLEFVTTTKPPPDPSSSTLRLPLEAKHFLRFGTTHFQKKGCKTGSKNLVQVVYKIILKYFPQNLVLWDEAKSQLGHYSWDEVNAEGVFLTGGPSDRNVVITGQLGELPRLHGGRELSFLVNSTACIKSGQLRQAKKDHQKDPVDGPEELPKPSTMRIRMKFIPGEVIYKDCEPFVKLLLASEKGKRCDNCFKKRRGQVRLQKCSDCQKVFYCSNRCREEDYKTGHDIECKSVAYRDSAVRDKLAEDFIYKILRTLIILKKNPELGAQLLETWSKEKKCFNDLPANVELFSRDSSNVEFCKEMSMGLRNVDGALFTLEETEPEVLMRLFGIWKTNEVRCYDEENNAAIAHGIFVLPSFLEHSCRPNCVLVQKGARAEVRCIAYVSPQEKLTLSKIPCTILNKTDRAETLSSLYGIDCHCDLCISEEEGDLVDYLVLSGMVTQAESLPQLSFKEVLDFRDQVIELFRAVFYEYDERVTGFCLACWHLFLVCQDRTDETLSGVLLEITADTEVRARVTLGIGHPDYVEFRNAMKKYGMMLGGSSK